MSARSVDEHLFSDETCDHQCIAMGRDGNHRCIDAIIAAHPDGVGPELAGFYLGMSKHGAEHLFARLVAKVTPRAKLARLGQ